MLEQSTIALRTTTFFYTSLALSGFMLIVLSLGIGVGIYYSSHFLAGFPEQGGPATDTALNGKPADTTPDVHEAYQERMDRLLKELGELSDRQNELEAKLVSKTTEAAEMANQTQLLRAQLRIKEREVKALAEMKAEPYELGRKFVRGPTRFMPATNKAGEPRGFYASENPRVKRAMAVSEFPAEILIDLNPPDARPGNPYRLRLEIHNRGNASLHVTDLELVWNYAGRNTGGPLPFSKRVVGPRSTSVLYEVDGVWIEELTEGTIVATVTLEGGGQLVNSLRWNEG
jgi:hypothetical protein